MSLTASPARRFELSRALALVVRPFRRHATASCAEVAAGLPAVLDGTAVASPVLVAHVESCLACQAELARYRRLVGLMRQLRSAEVAVPPGIVGEVLTALEAAANRRAIRSVLTGRRVAYGAAVVAGAGAGAGILLVALARRSGARPEPAAHLPA